MSYGCNNPECQQKKEAGFFPMGHLKHEIPNIGIGISPKLKLKNATDFEMHAQDLRDDSKIYFERFVCVSCKIRLAHIKKR